MRRFSRMVGASVLSLLASSGTVFAEHNLGGKCPLSLVGDSAPGSPFFQSPPGFFRNGSLLYSLRGQTLTTFSITETGEPQAVREDFIQSLGAREAESAAAYSNGYLFVSGNSGLEVFDLRNVRPGAGGAAPIFVSRTAGLHYGTLAMSGNLLVALNPANTLPCAVNGTNLCSNSLDIFNVATPGSPVKVASIPSSFPYLGFNDVAFVGGRLFATGAGGTFGFNLTNPAVPVAIVTDPTPGLFLATNGTNLLAIGQDTLISVFNVGVNSQLLYDSAFTLPSIVDRANPLMFHPEMWIDETRLITLIDEKNRHTGHSARTIAIDVFDLSVPQIEGYDDRLYENVTYTVVDEVKHDPIAVGPFVYVVGELSGTQVYGACGQMAGRIELDSLRGLSCGGAQIHGWVTGAEKITSVELYVDDKLLSTSTAASFTLRHDVSSRTPVIGWSLPANLDLLTQGAHILRAVGTDAAGNRRQFASQRVYSATGPGSNCTLRKRGGKR